MATNVHSVKDHFVDCFLSQDVDDLLTLFDEHVEWNLEATGESFKGLEKVRAFAFRAIASRAHTDDEKIFFTDTFAGDDHFTVEYTHRGFVTAEGVAGVEKASRGRLVGKEGALFEMKICIVCRLKGGKIDRVNEYYDILQAISPAGSEPKMFTG